jgi:hypothetical protein
MRKAKEKKSSAMKTLENIAGGPLTLGGGLSERSARARSFLRTSAPKKIGVSKSHLCDVEKGRKTLSPERARWTLCGRSVDGPAECGGWTPASSPARRSNPVQRRHGPRLVGVNVVWQKQRWMGAVRDRVS